MPLVRGVIVAQLLKLQAPVKRVLFLEHFLNGQAAIVADRGRDGPGEIGFLYEGFEGLECAGLGW